MEQLICDRLRDNLNRLKLNQAASMLDDILEQAESDQRSYLLDSKFFGLPFPDYLEQVKSVSG